MSGWVNEGLCNAIGQIVKTLIEIGHDFSGVAVSLEILPDGFPRIGVYTNEKTINMFFEIHDHIGRNVPPFL